ncbi:MAG TPA: hypothetical protein VN030_15955 [Cellvibrio sp.]|nr:hypothetical protein [Cellvibrio sp.]
MSSVKMKKIRSSWEIYCWPAAVNAVCLVGVLAALIGDGWWDLLSWVCLGGTVMGMALATISFPFGAANRLKAHLVFKRVERWRYYPGDNTRDLQG